MRILIADDHTVVAEGLRRMLDRPEFEVIGVVADGQAMVREASRLRPDLIITDVAMPVMNGIDAARKILEQGWKPKIIFLTMYSEIAYARAALSAGALGYVLKSAAGHELFAAIREASAGRIYISKTIAGEVEQLGQRRLVTRQGVDGLTQRQLEVLQLLAEGRQAKEIAAVLNLSPRTVEFHKYRIMKALGARTVADLARYAVKQGLVA